MSIIGVNNISTMGNEALQTEKGAFGKDAFFKMLIAQLQNQDPLNPMEGTEFTAQLAQFSSLEQLSNINQNLDTISSSQTISNNSQLLQLIGKDVQYNGDLINVKEGKGEDLQFELFADASEINIDIFDEKGNFIKTIGSKLLEAGKHNIPWDGKDFNGKNVQDGTYKMDISALNEAGGPVEARSLNSGTVKGVNYEEENSYLLLNDKKIRLSDVIEVTQK